MVKSGTLWDFVGLCGTLWKPVENTTKCTRLNPFSTCVLREGVSPGSPCVYAGIISDFLRFSGDFLDLFVFFGISWDRLGFDSFCRVSGVPQCWEFLGRIAGKLRASRRPRRLREKKF